MDEITHNPESSGEPSVPAAVVQRLSLYLRELQLMLGDGLTTTSSSQLGSRVGVTDAQLRKDLAHFGQFGYPGVGYRCDELVREIRRILGTDRQWPVALVGTGNLGRALLRYQGFADQGFCVEAAFDVDPHQIGRKFGSVEVYALDQLAEVVEARKIRLAIIAVPAAGVQEVADRLVAAGVVGLLNFAPVTLRVPDTVTTVGVDLAIELEQLSFAVVNQRSKL